MSMMKLPLHQSSQRGVCKAGGSPQLNAAVSRPRRRSVACSSSSSSGACPFGFSSTTSSSTSGSSATATTTRSAPAAAPAPAAAAAAAAAAANVKLPRSHIASSKRALEQLKEMQVNRYAGSTKPVLVSIGLTFHTAPLDLREKLAVPEPEWPRAIAELCQYPHIDEAAVLSTCNRMELYVVALSWHRGVREVEDWLVRYSGVPLEQLRPHLFLLRERDAAHHLMRVSAGLDSLVLGEGQILAQVRQVHKTGQKVPGFGRQLNGLFKQALSAGKRARAETAIASGSVSVSSAAVQLAAQKAAALRDAPILVVGAGKMGALLLRQLAARGCRRLTLVNRSGGRAAALAAEVPELDVEVRALPELAAAAAAAELVFTAATAEAPLLTAADVAALPPPPPRAGDAAETAAPRLRRFFDISVPRNVAPDVAGCADTELYNVDDLKEVVAASHEGRAAAARDAEALVLQELRLFEAWRDSLDTVPTIKALRNLAESIRGSEFERAAARLAPGSAGGVTLKQLAVVEELSRNIVNKLLHGPMTALRCGESADPDAVGDALSTMSALGRMFELAAPAPTAAPPR